jgi:2-(3-amino-3-carboxypropyl)histidine synthase
VDRAPLTSGSSIDLDLGMAVEEIRRRGAKRVGLQAPEGLKRMLPALARSIEERTGAEVVISGDPCYGACDLDMRLCSAVDVLIHLGHAQLGEGGRGKVIHIEARMQGDLGEAARRAVPLLKEKRVIVTTTVQHVHMLESAIEALLAMGIEGKVKDACGRARYPGQVLGCCYDAAKAGGIDECLFIGTGMFHPLGIALATGKRVIASDPLTGEVLEIDPEPILRRRFAAIAKASDAKMFAVLVSKKPGQCRMDLARRIKEMGKLKGKRMILVYLDNIEPDRLLNLGVDAAISTACPRVALDDAAKYRIPILTPQEFEVLLGERRWEEYGFDEIS